MMFRMYSSWTYWVRSQWTHTCTHMWTPMRTHMWTHMRTHMRSSWPYSRLHDHSIPISNHNLVGLFSSERGQRDLENEIHDSDLRMKKWHSKWHKLYEYDEHVCVHRERTRFLGCVHRERTSLMCCSVIQCVAVCYSVLQCVAVWCIHRELISLLVHSEYNCTFLRIRYILYATTHCNTLQHAATHCNELQHTATHCNTLSWELDTFNLMFRLYS